MKKYRCDLCGRIYRSDKELPIIQDEFGNVGDGCCTVGSLVEVNKEEDEDTN
jgi:hypothetical protein